MNFAAAEAIAKTVLYEGYILYPYRASSTKNQQRWNFGTLYPRAWAQRQRPEEPCRMVTECLVQTTARTELNIRVRCLQFLSSVENQDWQQGIPLQAEQNELAVYSLCGREVSFNLALHPGEPVVGLRPMEATLSIHAENLREGLSKIRLELLNATSVSDPETSARSPMLLQSMVSAHLLLGVENGAFVSLLDPAEEFLSDARSCQNHGAFPVLVGEDGQRSLMLSSPILLYDYPQIAPESTGDFFDGTEMDEMLALRVLTLTDAEKNEMRQGDEQARRILERVEILPAEHWMKVHGAIRGMRRVQEDETQGDR